MKRDTYINMYVLKVSFLAMTSRLQFFLKSFVYEQPLWCLKNIKSRKTIWFRNKMLTIRNVRNTYIWHVFLTFFCMHACFFWLWTLKFIDYTVVLIWIVFFTNRGFFYALVDFFITLYGIFMFFKHLVAFCDLWKVKVDQLITLST